MKRFRIAVSNKQKGVALLVCLMLLIIISILGITAMRISMSQSMIASSSLASEMAFQSAETAISRAIQQGELDLETRVVLPTSFGAPVTRCISKGSAITTACGGGTYADDKGVTVLMGGKRTLKIGDLMGTVVTPFMPMKTDEDYEALVDLAQKTIDFFAENALEHERTGEMIERIGLVNFLEGIEVEIDPNMVSTPRTNPYVRTDGWDDEVAKIKARKTIAIKAA